MSEVTFNGEIYHGNNICISNGKIFIDGKEVTSDDKVISISVEGSGKVSTISRDIKNKIIR